MRWRLERERGLYPPRGLGVWTCGGHLGSTYGEPGSDHFREVHVLVLRWHFVLRLSWKRPAPAGEEG